MTDHPLTETAAAELWAINHPDVDADLKVHAHADRGLAARIRAILNGEINE